MKKIILIVFFLLPFTLSFANNEADKSAGNEKAKSGQSASNDKSNTTQTVSKPDERFSSLGFSLSTNAIDPKDIDNEERTDSENTFINKPLNVFGQNLFGDQCKKLHLAHFFNPDYRIASGDHINVKMWGAFQFDKELEVDAQGNIFIPEIGPVHVLGVPNSQLNKLIQAQINKVFKRDVNTYADLVTSQPVQVYVTGFVKSPGLYDGLSSDSIIYFLCAADGISPKEGSYRHIEILRNGQKIHVVDLYTFLLNGTLTPIQLHQGDTVVVKALRHTIAVNGGVKNPYQYEFPTANISMNSLREIVNIEPSVTHVRIQRNRGKHLHQLYKTLEEANQTPLLAGDTLTFVTDKNLEQIHVTVKGQIKNQHQYILDRGTRLDELMKQVVLKKDANPNVLQLFRESVALKQKEGVDATLSRFEREVLTTAPQTDEEAKIQVAQSDMLLKFVNDAKHAKMKGQVVLGDKNTWHEIRLENNDIIHIPAITSVVTVSGEVVNTVSVERNPRFRVKDYIKAAGGFSERADTSQIFLLKQSGEVHPLRYSLMPTPNPPIEGGDEVIVLSKVINESWRKTGMISKMIYQIAIAAKVFLVV